MLVIAVGFSGQFTANQLENPIAVIIIPIVCMCNSIFLLTAILAFLAVHYSTVHSNLSAVPGRQYILPVAAYSQL